MSKRPRRKTVAISDRYQGSREGNYNSRNSPEWKDISIQIESTQQAPSTIDENITMPRQWGNAKDVGQEEDTVWERTQVENSLEHLMTNARSYK